MGKRKKMVIWGTVLASSSVLAITLWLSRPTWKMATEDEIRLAISPVLRTKVRPDLDEVSRSRELSHLLSSTSNSKVSRNQLQKVDEVLRSGPAIATSDGFGMAFFGRGRLRFDGNFYLDAPYRSSTPSAEGIAMLDRGELAALRALQASTNLTRLRSSLEGQIRADGEMNNALDKGVVAPPDLRSLRKRYFENSEIQAGVTRAVVGEFWELDILTLRHPEKPYLGISTRTVEEADLPGNYDALESAKQISSVYEELLQNCERPPTEATSKVETMLDSDAASLPTDGSVGKAGWQAFVEKLKYRFNMRMIRNSYGVGFVQSRLNLNKSLDQKRRADCLAAHRLLGVKLAAIEFWRVNRRKATGIQELVAPGFLKEIPLDPWSHGRMLFDSKTKTVYSAGHDRSLGLNSLLVSNPTTRRIGLSFKLP